MSANKCFVGKTARSFDVDLNSLSISQSSMHQRLHLVQKARQFALLSLLGGFLQTSSHAAIIVSATEQPAAASYADPVVVENGFGEDAKAFTDRFHQWNGVSTDNTRRHPTLAGLGLVGKDYVQTANNARAVAANDAAYQVTLSEDAQVFFFLDTRQTEPSWLTAMGFERIASSSSDGGFYRVGYDEGNDETQLGVGAGVDIATQAWVYTTRLSAGAHTFNGLGFNGNNNYGIVATQAGTLVGGIARIGSGNPTPALQRLAFNTGALAYVDRTHQWVVSAGVLNSLQGLEGADFIQTSNDARGASATEGLYEITLLEESRVYLFLDKRFYGEYAELHQWMKTLGFTDSLFELGIDESGNGSIDQTADIYQTTLGPGVYQFNGLATTGGMNNYGIAFSAIPEPTQAVLMMTGLLALSLRRRRKTDTRRS